MDTQQFGDLIIDHRAHEVSLGGEVLSLTRSEYVLLAALSEQPRRAISSDALLRRLWDTDWVDDTTAIQTHISRLRAKLGDSAKSPRWVVTVHGFGYRFEPDLGGLMGSAGQQFGNRDHDESEIVAYALVNLERKVLWVGGESERLLGFTSDAMTDTILYEDIHPEDAHLAQAARAELDAGLPSGMRFRMQTATGGYRTVEALARPLIGSGGSVEMFLGEYRATSSNEIGYITAPDAVHIATS